MSIFDGQHIRNKVNLCWGEDYVLGLVDRTAPTASTRILDLVRKQGAMSVPTAQKYLKSLLDRKLVSRKKDHDDRRLTVFSLTDKGLTIMKEIRDAVK
jgi:DNA-binding MarR family transcriptional regulator